MLQAAIKKLMGLTKSSSKKKSEPAREPTQLEKARIERARVYHNSRNSGSYDTAVISPMPHHTDFSSSSLSSSFSSSPSSSDDCSSSSSYCDSSSFSCD